MLSFDFVVRLLRQLKPFGLAIILVLLNLAGTAYGKNLDELMTLEQCRDLVKFESAKIPDLQDVWKWSADQKIKGVYTGGGLFRGLLVWIHTNLQTMTVEQLKAKPVPKVADLLIVKDADRDLYAPDDLKAKVLAMKPEWDVLNETFYQSSIKNGGSTVDKIRANPKWVDDPVGGLEDFYHGRLSYVWADTHSDAIPGDLNMNLALRFLRFTVDLGSALKPTAESMALIKTIPEREGKLIPQNTDNPTDFPKGWNGVKAGTENTTKYRIGKALKKLFQANGTHVIPTMKILKDAGLLHLLATKRYPIPGYDWASLPKFVPHFIKAEFNIEELLDVAAMLVWTVDEGVAYHKALALASKTPDDFIKTFTYELNATEAYKEGLAKLASSKDVLDYFLTLKPSAEQFYQLRKLAVRYVDYTVSVMNRSLEVAKTFSDLEWVLKYNNETPSPAYVTAVDNFILQKADRVAKLCDNSVENLNQLRTGFTKNIKTEIALITNALSFVKTPEQFVQLLDYCLPNPNDAYKEAMKNFIVTNTDFFLKLGPSEKDIKFIASNHGVDLTDLFEAEARVLKASSSEFAAYVTELAKAKSKYFTSGGFAKTLINALNGKAAASLRWTAGEALNLKLIPVTSVQYEALLKAVHPLTAQEFLDALSSNWQATSEQQKILEKTLDRRLGEFQNLSPAPTQTQYAALLKYVKTDNQALTLKILKASQTKNSESKAALAVFESLSDAQKPSIDSMVLEFCAAHPSLDDAEKFFKLLHKDEARMLFATNYLPQLTRPLDILKFVPTSREMVAEKFVPLVKVAISKNVSSTLSEPEAELLLKYALISPEFREETLPSLLPHITSIAALDNLIDAPPPQQVTWAQRKLIRTRILELKKKAGERAGFYKFCNEAMSLF